MRFNCGPTREERSHERARKLRLTQNRERSWHPHFAWWPVRDELTNVCLWLETVQRKRQLKSGWDYVEQYVFRATENVQ